MREADRLLQTILEAGDLVGQDDAGRLVIQLAVEPRDFDRLMAFGADAVEAEDGGDDEPYQCSPMSPCYLGRRRSVFCRPGARLGGSIVQAVAVAMLLVIMSQTDARADPAPVVAPLPTSTAQAPAQCCRICRKGQACGDECISAAKQCRASILGRI